MKQFPGIVAAARDRHLRDKSGTVRADRLRDLLERSLRRLGGVADTKDFWPLVLRKSDTVAIKVNCLAGTRLSTTPQLVAALVASLERSGVPPEQIIVWDRTSRELKSAGFTINRRGPGVRCFGTDEPALGYERTISFSGEVGSCLSRILTRISSVLINVGVVKDHDLAGVSIGMTNLYGIIHNPNKYHDALCDPLQEILCHGNGVRDHQ